MSIWVAGELIIDILPTGPVVGGGPANTAKALARLDHAVDFIDGISSDAFGEMARKELSSDGVSLNLSHISDKPTCTATITLDVKGGATYEFMIEGSATFDFEHSWLPDPERLKPSALHVGSLATIIEPGASVLFDWAMRVGEFAPILFDPNIRPSLMSDRATYRASVERWISISSVVKLSDEDMQWLYPDEPIDEVARRWIAGGLCLVVITRGANGLVGFTDGDMQEVDAPDVSVVDTVGAGDSVGAIIVEAIIFHSVASLRSKVLRDVLHRAAVAAGITCSRSGAQPPYSHELTKAMENNAVH